MCIPAAAALAAPKPADVWPVPALAPSAPAQSRAGHRPSAAQSLLHPRRRRRRGGATPRGLQLRWHALRRDVLFFLVAVAVLLWTVGTTKRDAGDEINTKGKGCDVTWVQSTAFVTVYLLYIMVCAFEHRMSSWWARFIVAVSHLRREGREAAARGTTAPPDDRKEALPPARTLETEEDARSAAARLAAAMRDALENHAADDDDDNEEEGKDEKEKDDEERGGGGGGGGDRLRVPLLSLHQRVVHDDDDAAAASAPDAVALAAHTRGTTGSIEGGDGDFDFGDEAMDHPLRWPQSVGPGLLHAVLCPLLLAWHLTMPSHASLPRWYVVTMLMSLAWLSVMAYVMTYCCEQIAKAWHVAPEIMGITVGAVGTSLPNVMASVAVARRSSGDMAVGNAIGSNIFTICIALGAPWLVASAIRGGRPVEIPAETGLWLDAVVLAMAIALFLGVLAVNGFILTRAMGWMCIAEYTLYATFKILQAVDVVRTVRLPW